jgi:hypothetical protein
MRINIPDAPSIEPLDGAYSDSCALLERNAVIFCEIYGAGMLKMDAPANSDRSEYLFPVTDPRFSRFDELKDYIESTYIRAEADKLLGNGRYADVYGSLYGDRRKDSDMNYYVNWKTYSCEITGFSDSEAKLTAYTTNDTPEGARKVTISTNIIYENGVWLLEKMIY